MFESTEYEYDPKIIQRIPLLEGTHFQNLHHDENAIRARIERPFLSKDVLEQRSAQTRTLDVSGFIFDENNRVVGRQVFSPNLSGIPEDDLSVRNEMDTQSFFSVGGSPARVFDATSNTEPRRISIGNSSTGPGTLAPSPRTSQTSGASYVVLTAEESRRYLNWADAEDAPGSSQDDW